jgi:hypothetical protein
MCPNCRQPVPDCECGRTYPRRRAEARTRYQAEPPLDQMPCECSGCPECTDADMCLEPKVGRGPRCRRCRQAAQEEPTWRAEELAALETLTGADAPRHRNDSALPWRNYP